MVAAPDRLEPHVRAAMEATLDLPVVESFVPVQPHAPALLKIVCFNIQRGQRLLKVLQALKYHPDLTGADVICLQEVDRYNNRTGGIDLARLIAWEMQMNLTYGVEFFELNMGRRSGGGDHGNAILTRLPTGNARIIGLPMGFDWSRSLTHPRLGRRMAIAVDLTWGDHTVRIINAHLENQCLRRYRMAQVETLLTAEKEQIARGPTVLVGDMNTFLFREPAWLGGLCAPHGLVDVMPARPRGTWGTVFKLDWILARNLDRVASGVSRTVRSSDHKPLWAVFARPGQV